METSLTKMEINLTKKEIAVYSTIQRIGKGDPADVKAVSKASRVKGKSFSGIISSLRKKKIISTNGFQIFY